MPVLWTVNWGHNLMSQTKKHCEPLVAVWLRPSTTEPCICCKQVAEKPRGEHLKHDVWCMYILNSLYIVNTVMPLTFFLLPLLALLAMDGVLGVAMEGVLGVVMSCTSSSAALSSPSARSSWISQESHHHQYVYTNGEQLYCTFSNRKDCQLPCNISQLKKVWTSFVSALP